MSLYDLYSVGMDSEPHDTHEMSEWKQDQCDLNTPRFGWSRQCTACGGEDWKCGGAGSRWQDEQLSRPCGQRRMPCMRCHTQLEQVDENTWECPNRHGTWEESA